jgi:hypothetical protein
MKISALLSRGKGRDFYDTMFLLGLTEPDYGYLAEKASVHDNADINPNRYARNSSNIAAITTGSHWSGAQFEVWINSCRKRRFQE